MWLRPQGYAEIVSPEQAPANLDGFQCERLSVGSNKYDTTSCNHCNRVTHIKAKMDPAEMGGLCKICMKMICRHCVGNGCTPFEKRLEQMEKRAIALRSYGL
jgi:uncharacterized protein YprB with RNaseH-like and TPR domain